MLSVLPILGITVSHLSPIGAPTSRRADRGVLSDFLHFLHQALGHIEYSYLYGYRRLQSALH